MTGSVGLTEGSAPGVRLGLPSSGRGSVASLGARIGGFACDAVISGLVAAIFTAPHLPGNASLVVFVLEYVVCTAVLGQTPGMWIAGIRLVRVDGERRTPWIGIPRAIVRTLLLIVVIPAVVWNRDSRGLHDRAAGVVMVRSRA